MHLDTEVATTGDFISDCLVPGTAEVAVHVLRQRVTLFGFNALRSAAPPVHALA